MYWLIFATTVSAADTDADQSAEQIMQESAASGFAYGKKGLQFTSANGNNFLWFGVRLQVRFASSTIQQVELPGQPTEQTVRRVWSRPDDSPEERPMTRVTGSAA